ncbi:MAG: sodium ion-translocating decarboxylase subunit beta [Oscillospiraceae bacterium]
MQWFFDLFANVANFTWQQGLMLVIGGVLIALAITKNMEPALLLPMGFGAILVNLPFVNTEALATLFEAGIASELFPLLLFIGIGAMLDFGPLLSNPKLLLFGAAAQFGIFFTLAFASLLGFSLTDAASIAIIGAADGPTSIYVSNYFGSHYQGAILVAAYSYMALVPIVQPPIIRAVTTKKERQIRMDYQPGTVSKRTRILFPILVTVLVGTLAPKSAELIGFLMFGNLIRECGVLRSLSESAQHELANLITLLLGLSVSFQMRAELFVTPETLLILALGLVAFVMDTAGGVLFAKVLNLFCKNKVNPMIGAAGISAFPMASRVVHQMGRDEDPFNYLLMHAAGANVAGQIASVIAGGLIITLVEKLL